MDASDIGCDHLSEAARRFLALTPSAEQREKYIVSDRFVRSPRSNAILTEMEQLMLRAGNRRCRALLVCGAPGSGKSAIIDNFLKQHYPDGCNVNDPPHMPILHVDLSGAYSETRFLPRLLDGIIHCPKITSSNYEKVLARGMAAIKALECRMLILDEVQDLLAGMARDQHKLLTCIKFISNRLRIPICAFGSLEAAAAFKSEPHLASRFTARELRPWEADDQLRGFVQAYVKTLPLHYPSSITDSASIQFLISATDGLTQDIVELINRAAVTAIGGAERIDYLSLRDAQ